MLKRFLAIISIFFLLITSAFIMPIKSGYFLVYADDTPVENLSTQEVILAGLTVYLNSRNAWLTDNNYDPNVVQATMENWITTYSLVKNSPIGNLATLASHIIIRYNPFNVSLKGPAIRAFNDLFNYLRSKGYFDNAANSNGGTTSDEVYDGYFYGNKILTIIDSTNAQYLQYGNTKFYYLPDSKVQYGNVVDNATGKSLYDTFMSAYPNYNINSTGQSYAGTTRLTLNVASGWDYQITITGYGNNNNYAETFGMKSGNDVYPYIGSTGLNRAPVFNTMGTYNYIGGYYLGFDRAEAQNKIFLLNLTNDENNKIFFSKVDNHTLDSTPPTATVNFDTDSFVKTDPTVPDDPDEEVTYTPKDKETGNTYNTYNNYITNYVQKKTTVNNPDSGGGGTGGGGTGGGGTVPPSGNGSGTLTPNGNGGYDLSLPDLTLPDFDGFNWSINGLSQKFPFSIPWDLMAFFTVLNASPETPEIQARIPLGIWEWNIDWDLHNFDNLAALLRNLEFIGFCIGLILITRSIIKG